MSVRTALTGVPLKAARWSAEHPWRAIGAWAVLVTVAVGLAMAVPTQQTVDADYRQGESGRADAMVVEAGLDDPDTENVLVTSAAQDPLDRADAQAAAAELADRLRAVEGVARVDDPVWSQDRSALLLAAQLARDQEDPAPLHAVVDDVRASYDGLEIAMAGDLTIDEAINERVAEDLESAEVISLPVTLILMLLAFGALIAAGIPVLLAITSVAATVGVTAPLSHLVHSEPTVTSMIVLIGMAVGVDYSLFYLKREREERASGRSTLDAVEIAAATSGHSIVVSGLAVIASMTGLYVFGGATFNSLATGAILVVATAVLGSVTVLPALLVKLGRWVDRPRVPLLWRVNRRIGHGGISSRVLGPVVRRPGWSLLASGAVVTALAVPALGMTLHASNLDTLPPDLDEVQTFQRIAEEFPNEGTTATVVVRGPEADREARVAALTELDTAARATPDFVDTGVESIATSADGTTSTLELAMPHGESDPRADTALRELRRDLVPAALGGLDAEYAVGGAVAESVDFVDRIGSRLPLVIGMVLLLTLLVMGGVFRSVPIALVSTVLNLASVGVAFGLMTLVFEHGWGSSWLDFTTPGFLIDWVPLLVLVVLVGLSMDYHVFVMSRVREHVDRGLPTWLAVQRGIADSAGVVTSAAAVMVSVFAIFATLSMMEMKMMGVGLSAAILVDATLIRLVMLPAALVLMGDRVWWPRRPRRPAGTAVVAEQEPAYAAR
ncbi:MAG: MMPL family transporter [Nocardioides sp.]